MLFSVGVARPQSREVRTANNQNITALNIGDQIPDALWNTPLQVVNHPQGKRTITLADYKGKLIILDFWATYCSPCIKNFPKLHALQNEFADKIKVLAVTGEPKEKINKFFTAGAGKGHTYVNSVINDSVLSNYFPNNILPHIVWIAPNGKVLNTTQAEEITPTNIRAVLDNNETQMTSKVDIDRDRPLFLSEHFGSNLQLKGYSIFAKGYYPGLPSAGNFKKTKEGKIFSRQMTNQSMMDIYRPVLEDLFSRNGEKFNRKRVIVDVKQPALLNPILKPDGTFEEYNLFNYELIVPGEKADSLSHYVLNYLNEYSDYMGSIEKRMVECLILVRTSSKDLIKSKGGKLKNTFPNPPSILSNLPIAYMVNRLIDDTPIDQLIIDETGYTDNVDIEISGVRDLASLKKELNRYDLDLIPAKRSLNMFVIKDK
ncbi:TlpA family protein disulfide reductase [Pedobacter antarcticus]|nr:TlpA disulfide reductase family protein [Pedobacter antarcticus]